MENKNTSVLGPRSSAEIVFEIASVVGIVLIVFNVSYYWALLPETVPMHFNLVGEPDGWGPRWTTLILPTIGILIFTGITILSRYPHLYNLPWPLTQENATRQYSLARGMVTLLKTEIIWLFSYMHFMTIQVALGKSTGLGSLFIAVVFMLILGTIGIYLYVAKKAR